MLDDLRRALRMDSPAPRLSESNLRKLSRGLRSSKKSRLSVHSGLETQSVQDGSLGNRSVSLSTLLPSGGGGGPGSVPRVDKLQSLEAKMASIEVSLGWRRRREALLETLPRAARELVRELDSLHQTVREKENCIQGLRTQITNLGGTVAGLNDGCGGIVSESEKRTIQERLEKVESEIETKKVAVKNLKLTLDKIDITDNIDVRIRAAELEYELEREELNILNLKEEASVLNTRLQESCSSGTIPGGTVSSHQKPRITLQELLTLPGNSSIVSGISLVSASVSYTPGNPPFHVTCRPPYGCVIDWATDDTRLKKGDRLLEINGEIVLGKNIEDVTNIMSSTPSLSLVVGRPVGEVNSNRKFEKQLEEKLKENKELTSKLEKTVKERDTLKNDNTRLNHRISYLEDQVNELQSTLQKAKDEALINGSPNEVLTPSQPGATIIQVFQKGHQTLAVAGADLDKSDNRVQEYPTLPRLKSPSCSSRDSGSTKRIDEIAEEDEEEESSKSTGASSPLSHATPTNYQVNNIVHTKKHLDSPSEQQKKEKQFSDDVSKYQKFSIKFKQKASEEKIYDNKSEDYDCIEKLRDRLTEKSPSYSYSTPNELGGKHNKTTNDQTKKQSNPNSNSNYEYICPEYSEQSLYGRITYSRESNGPRPSSREDLLSPKEEEGKVSRNVNIYERPIRRLMSPGADDMRPTRPRPIPPKKPERLSLHRTTSMQSVEDSRCCSEASMASSSSRSRKKQSFYPSSDNIYSHKDEIYDTSNGIQETKSLYEDDTDRDSKNDRLEGSYPIPSLRNIFQNGGRKSSNHVSKEHRRLTISSTESVSNYESPYAKHTPFILNGHNSYSKARSQDAAFHLDTSLGLDLHEDVRARPLHEYIYQGSELTNGQKNQRLLKQAPSIGKDKDHFDSPPTPSTPPRGINLSMKNSGKTGEEWC